MNLALLIKVLVLFRKNNFVTEKKLVLKQLKGKQLVLFRASPSPDYYGI